MPVKQGQALNSIAMDWINAILPGIIGLFGVGIGGTFLRYIIFPRITKRTEQAGADSSVLNNLEKVSELQGKALVKATEEKMALSEVNSQLLSENYNLKSKLSEYDFEISNIKRVQTGLQKAQNAIVSQLKYAQNHICLNLPCQERIPTLGTYKEIEHEKEGL